MIKIIERSKTTVETVTPYYTLIYNYTIGDTSENITREVYLSIDNPYIERYCTLLTNLLKLSKHYKLILSQETIETCFGKEQITEDDYDFLMRTMFLEGNRYLRSGKENNYANEFYEGIAEELGYDFLVFEGVKLTYTNEHNVIFDTKFVKYG